MAEASSSYPSDLHYQTDNHEIGANGKSMFEPIANIFTKGIPLTGLSIYNSFVNTGVDVANFFGAEAERNDPVRQLEGYDEDLMKYYREHSQGVEAAGLIVGSVIPGLTAVKMLKVAGMGKGADGIAKATGLFAGKKQAVLDEATEFISSGKMNLFGNIEAQKWKAIAYGFGDQALQAAAWEVATIATMKANPLLDKDGFGDVMSNVMWGTILGGGIGGVLEGIATRGVINNLKLGQEFKEKVFETATRHGIGNFNHGDYVVDLLHSLDKFDTTVPTTPSEIAKVARTRAQAEVDSMKILKEISPGMDENLGKTFLDTLLKMRNESKLNAGEMYDYLGRLGRISRPDQYSHVDPGKIQYVRTSLEEFAETTGEEVGGVSHLRPIVSGLLKDYVNQGPVLGRAKLEQLAASAPEFSGFAEEVAKKGFIDDLHEQLVKRTEKFTGGKKYLTEPGTTDARFNLFTSDPSIAVKNPKAYVIRDGESGLKVARFDDIIENPTVGGRPVNKYSSPSAAFSAGEDIFIDSKLMPHVNPASQKMVQVARPGESRILTEAEEKAYRTTGKVGSEKGLLGAPTYFNILSGRVTDRAYAVFGDLGAVPHKEGIAQLEDILTRDSHKVATGVKVGEYASPHFSLESGFGYHDLNALDANARYVWMRARGIKDGDIINYNDLPALEELTRWIRDKSITTDKLKDMNLRLRQEDGKLTELSSSASELNSHIWVTKDGVIKELLGDGSKKVAAAEVALKANVPIEYLEKGLQASNFEGVSVPVDRYLKTNTIKLEYDIGDISIQEGNILRGMIDVQYRVAMAKTQALNATYNFFKDKTDALLAGKYTADDSNTLGAGARGLTAASAEYGTLAQRTEAMGAELSKWMVGRHNYVSDQMSRVVAAFTGDDIASAELAVVTNIGRRVARAYTLVPDAIVVEEFTKSLRPGQRLDPAEIPRNVMSLEGSIKRDADGKIIGWNRHYVPQEGSWVHGRNFGTDTAQVDATLTHPKPYTYMSLNPKVYAFLEQSTKLNDERLVHHNNWLAAQGDARQFDLGKVYFPPVDTTKYKYVAIVRDKLGRAFGTSDAAAIVSDSAQGLQAKVNAVLQEFPEYRINFKENTKDYHQAVGDYDYSLNLAESAIDSNLRKKGILSDILPNVRGDVSIKEHFDWHIRQEDRQARNFMELGNAQLFEELRALGKKFTEVETSTTGGTSARFFRTITDPFDSYVKTALNISPKSEYRLWQDTQEKLEAFGATAFRMAKEFFGQAEKGLISYEEATKLTAKFGLGNPYQRTLEKLGESSGIGTVDPRAAMEAFAVANKLPLTPILSQFIQKANSVIAATNLRLDAFQTLINVISTPVLQAAEYTSVKNNPRLAEMLLTELPDGSKRLVPAYGKAIFTAMGKVQGAETKDEILQLAERLGTVNKDPRLYYEMLDNLTIAPLAGSSKIEAAGKRAVEIGVKISRSDWGEQFTRLVSTSLAKDLFEALGHTGTGLDDQIRTFVNRVHGNYIASQRPVAFQGPIGQAMGLFQTYQFNLLQNVFRYVEGKEKLPLATLFGLQGSLFGLQGIPGFQAINTHIVGNSANNPEHKDFYSVVPQFFDKPLGNWLLYGSVSNFLSTGLYTRGDINPRQITVLPVNPLDYPAIGASIKFVGNLVDIGQKMAGGGKLSDTLLQGLEHNGLSRPLAGLAQVINGYSTTTKGGLISGSNDWDTITYASRILGSRPLDEAVAMDALYRKQAYQAKDRARIGQLGDAVKTTLVGNGNPSSEQIQQFAADYAQAGGRIEHFGAKMIEWTKDANQSVANKIYQNLRNPLNQNMMKIMGGDMLPDYTRAGQPDLTTIPGSFSAGPSTQ